MGIDKGGKDGNVQEQKEWNYRNTRNKKPDFRSTGLLRRRKDRTPSNTSDSSKGVQEAHERMLPQHQETKTQTEIDLQKAKVLFTTERRGGGSTQVKDVFKQTAQNSSFQKLLSLKATGAKITLNSFKKTDFEQ